MTIKTIRYNAPALDKGLDILEYLSRAAESLTLVEIAKGLDRRPAEIYRMLDTLNRRGYITRTGDLYANSLKMLSLANQYPPLRRLRNIAEPIMRKATNKSEQSCQMAVWEHGRIVVISSVAALGNWRLSIPVGMTLGLYNTGSGRTLAAFQDKAILDHIIKEHQLIKGEIKFAKKKFIELTQEVKQKGYCIMRSETISGAVNLSFPILDSSGFAIACITSPYLERIDSYQQPSIEKTTEIFSSAVKEISQLIGNDIS